MKYYEFIDREPPIDRVVVIEGEERVLADAAIDLVLDRVLEVELRDLNLTRFSAETLAEVTQVREALAAMPFLAERRVVVVTDAQTLRASTRESFAAVLKDVPQGNTLIVSDLVKPLGRSPVPMGRMAGRDALRIDTTATQGTRTRFIEETLKRVGAAAERRVIEELARSEADLAAIRNDLEKLALSHKNITHKALEGEALTIKDPKLYVYSQATVEGQTAKALAVAHEVFATDPRRAAMGLLRELAIECRYVWALTHGVSELPENRAWRARTLEPLARRIGERRARRAYERVVHAMEAIVTGGAGSGPDDERTLIDRMTVEFARLTR